jgi:hypothetical protein
MQRVVALALALLCLVALAHGLIEAGYRLDIPRAFPCSVFTFEPHYAGAIWLAAFLGLLLVAVRRVDTFTVPQLWLVALLLTLLSNLGQGGVQAAFFDPLVGVRYVVDMRPAPRQYCHAFAWVESTGSFLRDFTTIQREGYGVSELCHVRTHPPFTTLLHYWLRNFGGLACVAATFTVVSSLAVFAVADLAGKRVALLFAVLPAVSIYSAVSVDGVVMACFALMLWGLMRRRTWAVVAGLLMANALTFGALWGFLVLLLLGRRRELCWSLLFGALALVACRFVGYDHVAAFMQTAVTENPAGTVGALEFGRVTWTAIADPGRYWLTRLEGVAEVALFLSLPVLAAWRWHAFFISREAQAAVVAFLLMLAAGVWCSGETARACLFLYPFLILPFGALTKGRLAAVTLAAGLQTALMQGVGDWFF